MEEVPALPGTELSPARSRQSMVLDARRSALLSGRRPAPGDPRRSKLMPDGRKSMVIGAPRA